MFIYYAVVVGNRCEIVAMTLCYHGTKEVEYTVLGCLSDSAWYAADHHRIICAWEWYQFTDGFWSALLVGWYGYQIVLNGSLVIFHHGAHRCSTHIYLAVGRCESHSLVTQFLCDADIVLLHGCAGESEQSFLTPWIHELELAEISLSLIVSSEIIESCGTLISGYVVCRIISKHGIKVGQSLLILMEHHVYVSSEFKCLLSVKFAVFGIFESHVYIIERTQVVPALIIYVGSTKQNICVMRIFFKELVVSLHQSLRHRVIHGILRETYEGRGGNE